MKFKKLGTLSQLVNNAEEHPFSIKSNFGTTQFIGVGQTPKNVLSKVDDLLQGFLPDNKWGQQLHIIRVEVKLCPEGVQLIEIEQQPTGVGIFLKASEKGFSKQAFGVVMKEVTVLYSEGRTKNGAIHSDDHLFTDKLFRWEEYRDTVGPIIVRSRDNEKLPDWLRESLEKTKGVNLLMPIGGIDKAATYKKIGLPHLVFPDKPNESQPFPKFIKQTLFNAMRVFKVRRVILKPRMEPRMGIRGHQVSFGHNEIMGIKARSKTTKNLKKNPNRYVLRPYHKGVYEKEVSVSHLYQLFYVQEVSNRRYLGGTLALDDLMPSSKMVVHNRERVRHILLV